MHLFEQKIICQLSNRTILSIVGLMLMLPLHAVSAQQSELVDFLRITATVQPTLEDSTVAGRLDVSFRMRKDADSVYLNGMGMHISQSVNPAVRVSASDDKVWFSGNFQHNLEYTASFDYVASPKQAMYFTGNQIWTQGQGKNTSHWLPSIDDMNEKIEFDLSVIAPSDKTVIANGKLLEVVQVDFNSKIWNFDMTHPMSSYLVAVVIGDFNKTVIRSESGVPIELYFTPSDSLKTEPTYRYTGEIFNFLEKEIGVSYPWQNYKQVPVRDFLYAGMENTTATIFSEAFVVDSIGFTDRNYVNVNAHELAHQWFGNLVTARSGTHHWLQEGFSTYYAQLAEKEVFGDDYFYWKLYQSAEQLLAMSEEGRGESLLNPSAGSLTFYEKGAWALHILKELIGDEAFSEAVKNYLHANAYQNAITDDFIAEIEKVTDVDISRWKEDWLRQTAFKASRVFEFLMKSEFMNRYFDLVSRRDVPLEEKYNILETAIRSGNSFIADEAIFQLGNETPEAVKELYLLGFQRNDVYIRQSLAYSFYPTVPQIFQNECESLLTDNSYVTREAALLSLWNSFPQAQPRYLDATSGIQGFQNKSFRHLWLSLALATNDYREEQKAKFKRELQEDTAADKSFEIRESAFQNINRLHLNGIDLFNPEVTDNLINGCVHHYWRFRDYCRQLLDSLMEKELFKALVIERFYTYSEKERAYLNKKFEME